MKRKFLLVLSILLLAFGLANAALAAPPETGQDQVCPHDTDGWSSHQEGGTFHEVEGADEYCGKGGSEQSACVGYLVTGSYEEVLAAINAEGACDNSHWSYHTPEYEACDETTTVYGEWSDWEVYDQDESLLVRSRSITYFDAQDGETVCGSDVEYEYMDRPICEWNEELYADDPECQPPPGEAGGSLSPYCGGGVNVTVANATMYIQFADQDPIIITEGGKYPLDLGSYVAWLEASEGYEFPEGATTRWEFGIDRCPSPPEEPETGPLDSIPLNVALPIAGSGATGIYFLALSVADFLKRRRQVS